MILECDDLSSDSIIEVTTAIDGSSKTPSKKAKLEVDSKAPLFKLKDDRLTDCLPTPFPFPTNYSPEITAAIANGSTTPRIVEKFITALARAAYAHKCYPTAEEFNTLAKEAVEKYECFAVGSGCKHVSSLLFRKIQIQYKNYVYSTCTWFRYCK